MKRRSHERSSGRRENSKMKVTPAGHLQVQQGQISAFPLQHHRSSSSFPPTAVSPFQNLLEAEVDRTNLMSSSSRAVEKAIEVNVDDKDCILSQDFFWTISLAPDHRRS
ncbi:hypothetical protein L6164_010200 [Bauhinia variegata]|uniref:Uncharacterized protein n=1 Tax=Bauhinia variegata TaxID=167791 RepID=A0ACB9PM75_BAUVA|nr:hypothetical protein L6164_010200 [Bauhinia variegata]